MKLLIFTKDYCKYCEKLKSLLTTNDIQYSPVDLGKHPNWLQYLVTNGFKSVPQAFWEDSKGGLTYIGDYSTIEADIGLVK